MTSESELPEEPTPAAPAAMTPDQVGVLKVMASSESLALYSHVLEAEEADGTIHHSNFGTLLILAASSAPNSYAYLTGLNAGEAPLLPASASVFLRKSVPILIGVLLGCSALVSVGAALAGFWMSSGVSAAIFFAVLLPVLTTARKSKEDERGRN